MKQATLCAFALLLAACHDEPAMTFGLGIGVFESGMRPEDAISSCLPPGRHSGETSGFGSWPNGAPPPYLFVETEPDAEENVYHLQVFVALEQDEEDIWWIPSEVLAERVYDSAFGEGGQQDSFEVDFEGQPHTIEVLGLPPATTCP